jgi:hypothetical protein
MQLARLEGGEQDFAGAVKDQNSAAALQISLHGAEQPVDHRGCLAAVR